MRFGLILRLISYQRIVKDKLLNGVTVGER